MKNGNINLFEYINNYSNKFEMNPNIINERINKLQAIKNISIGRIVLGSSLSIETVTEIFVRINSKGVVLSQADFAMSKISVNEEYEGNDIRKAIDYFCHFAKTPVDYENIKNNDTDFSQKEIFNKIKWIEDSCKKLYEGVKAFVDKTNFERYVMILKSAGIIDDSLIRSQNVLNFGYILFLLLREKKESPDVIEKLVKKWVIMSIITQRYSSSPESQFDVDIRRLNDAEDLVNYIELELSRNLTDTFWDSILVEKFNTSVASSPFWKTYLIAQIALNDNAFLSKDMKVRTLVEGRGDVHHIFPKNYLQKNGKNNMSVYNQIANFALIQTETNLQISDMSPKEYMQIVNTQCTSKGNEIGSINEKDKLLENLKINCIPESLYLMNVDDYDSFLKQRRILMAKKIKDYYNTL